MGHIETELQSKNEELGRLSKISNVSVDMDLLKDLMSGKKISKKKDELVKVETARVDSNAQALPINEIEHVKPEDAVFTSQKPVAATALEVKNDAPIEKTTPKPANSTAQAVKTPADSVTVLDNKEEVIPTKSSTKVAPKPIDSSMPAPLEVKKDAPIEKNYPQTSHLILSNCKDTC